MKYKITLLFLIISFVNAVSQNNDSTHHILEPLDWEIMFCGRSDFGHKESCKLIIKNETDNTIQGYWLNYFNKLTKVKFGRIESNSTKTWNIKANEYWVFADSNNNALGIYQTRVGTNEIIINKSNYNNSVKLTNTVIDRSINGTNSGGKRVKEQASYDVLHYNLILDIQPNSQFVKGKNTITAKILENMNEFVFDLDSLLTIENVFLNVNNKKTQLPFKTKSGKHFCSLPSQGIKGELLIVEIEFSGKPRVSTHAPYKGGFSWNKTANCQHWIATSCQIDGADILFPCKDYQWDKPDSVNLSFTVPTGLKAISNGILVDSINNNNNTTTFLWKVSNPISNYNIAVNIAPYTYLSDTYICITNKKLDLGYWVLPENVPFAKEFYPNIKDYLAFLEKTIGTYPFRNEKLGIVEVPFNGMEHQTIIAYGPNYSTKFTGYNSVFFHELCHEWFGNMVTAEDWKDFWIQEAFCGYLEALYEESLHGEEGYRKKIQSFNRRLGNRIPLAPDSIVSSREIYSGDVYKKGAFLLHTLRYLIGKDNIMTVIRSMAYPDKNKELISDGNQCRFTNTDEFFQIAEDVSNQELDWFKDVYFKNAGLPVLEISETESGIMTKWITKNNLPFQMPLEIKTNKGIQKVEFDNNKAVLDFDKNEILEIDPNNWILFNIKE